jgi:hypothetical protein
LPLCRNRRRDSFTGSELNPTRPLTAVVFSQLRRCVMLTVQNPVGAFIGVASVVIGGATLWQSRPWRIAKSKKLITDAFPVLRRVRGDCHIWRQSLPNQPSENRRVMPDDWTTVVGFADSQKRDYKKRVRQLGYDLRALQARIDGYTSNIWPDHRNQQTPESLAIAAMLEAVISKISGVIERTRDIQ